MGKIEIKGPIISDGDQFIYDWFGIPATSPKKVGSSLESFAEGEEINVIINSGGGDVFAGSEIYTILKSYEGKVVGKIVGIAASAASVIAMGVDKLEMAPTAQIMIHRASTSASGNKSEFEHTANVLSGIDESIASAYQGKTGIKTDELLDMMSKETWLTAQKAKEIGFIDAIMFEAETTVLNSMADKGGILPKEVVDKIRNELAEKQKPISDEKDTSEIETAKAKLKMSIII